jgi:PAS domain S-box-containing protein
MAYILNLHQILIMSLNANSVPLIAGDFFLETYHKLCGELNGTYLKEVYQRMAQNYEWTTPIDEATEDYAAYQAFIISDSAYNVVWVDSGFTKMTGYEGHEIIGKKPNALLHGPQTIQADRDVFRKQLKTGKSFSAKITNHRKNGEAYVCEVKIVPLYNAAKELTHFLALEKEVA